MSVYHYVLELLLKLITDAKAVHWGGRKMEIWTFSTPRASLFTAFELYLNSHQTTKIQLLFFFLFLKQKTNVGIQNLIMLSKTAAQGTVWASNTQQGCGGEMTSRFKFPWFPQLVFVCSRDRPRPPDHHWVLSWQRGLPTDISSVFTSGPKYDNFTTRTDPPPAAAPLSICHRAEQQCAQSTSM